MVWGKLPQENCEIQYSEMASGTIFGSKIPVFALVLTWKQNLIRFMYKCMEISVHQHRWFQAHPENRLKERHMQAVKVLLHIWSGSYSPSNTNRK